MSDVESGDGLGTPVYLVPNRRCRTCGVLRRDDGRTCINCDHYQNERVDWNHQNRKRLDPTYRQLCDQDRLRRVAWEPELEEK